MLSNSLQDHSDISLFERYLDGELSPAELQDFHARLKSDTSFATDFRIYAFSLQGLKKQADEDNVEFGIAMRHLDDRELRRIIGTEETRRIICAGETGDIICADEIRGKQHRGNKTWIAVAASVALIVMAGLFVGYDRFSARTSADARIDDIIVAYNYIPLSDRGAAEITDESTAALEAAYRDAPADDLQAQEDAGLRLAMAYLREHDRKRAAKLLTEMEHRFATADPDFAARCRLILSQLR